MKETLTTADIIEALWDIHEAQRDALSAHMEATRPGDPDAIDQALWEATQRAIWATDGVIRKLEGKPMEPWEEEAFELRPICSTCGGRTAKVVGDAVSEARSEPAQ